MSRVREFLIGASIFVSAIFGSYALIRITWQDQDHAAWALLHSGLNPKDMGPDWAGNCPSETMPQTAFTATNSAGKTLKGVVCGSTLFKNQSSILVDGKPHYDGAKPLPVCGRETTFVWQNRWRACP